MKRIFWFINQLCKVGGTEMVSLELAKSLRKDYEVTIVLLYGRVDSKLYNLEDIKTIDLDVPREVTCIEDYISKKSLLCKIKTSWSLSTYLFSTRFHLRKKILGFTKDDDILIYSSYFSYELAPKGRKNIYHYHYNAYFFNKPLNRLILKFLVNKPKQIVFLSEKTAKLSKTKREKSFIYNFSRLSRIEDLASKGNNIGFFERFEEQKRPLLALEVIKSLSLKTRNFKVYFRGGGSLYKKMKKYIEDNSLNDIVSLIDEPVDIDNALDKIDVLLLTSKFEGFGLTIAEGDSRSVPTFAFNFGEITSEMIANGESGVVVSGENPAELAEKLYEYLSEHSKLVSLKEGAYRYSERFTKSTVVKKREDILRE